MGGFLNRIFQFSIFNFISHPFISQSSISLVIGHWTSVISNSLKMLLVSIIIITLYPAQVEPQSGLSQLKTRAERTNYVETSRYDDVVAFLDTVAKASSLVHTSTFGYTFEGRPLPLAVVGRVSDAKPATVRASGKLRIYIQANIHAGEVEGKESALALVRDIVLGHYAQWLDSMVLLVAPIYNADGNERVSLTNRGPQHGPIGGMRSEEHTSELQSHLNLV